MKNSDKISEKYEFNGIPSISRPDVLPPSGWDLSLITAQERYRNHQLSPDGSSIVLIKDSETLSDIFTISTNGSWPSRLTTNRNIVAYWDDEIPQWSPDSQYIAFCIDNHVHIVNAKSVELPKIISDLTSSAWAPHWMPDSRQIIISTSRFGADQLVLTDKDGSWPRPLTNSPLGDHWDACPSPNGELILITYRPFDDLNRTDICLVNILNSQSFTIYGKPGIRAWNARWSPDGKQIAFISQEAGHNDVWLVKPDGDGLRRLTKFGYDVGQFVWSPDGNQLLLTINRCGSLDLSIIEISSGYVTDLRAGNGVHNNPNWSQEGNFITYEYESPLASSEIFRLDLSTKIITQLTFSCLPALAANHLSMPARIQYRSFDNLEIPAFLFQPINPNGAAILVPHGGPSSQYSLEWDVFVQYLVAKGYTVLAPNYRGSTGYGVDFEHANYGQWGDGDTQDCLYGARYLLTIPGIDRDRLAIFGGSYGGYLTNCCLARDPEYHFSCGITKYGDANTLSSWALCNRELRLYSQIFLGHPGKNRSVYKKSSPIYDVANVQKPILLLHGLDDDIVPPEASEEWALALRSHGKTYEYKTYSGESHGFLKRINLIDAYTRIERFLDWYLFP